ncbi:MAG: DUF4296 domain-containing protein [Bacteroidales bacterium]|nr:DUF4296 domain-containing protein [Bacteroidales bacterium]
MRFSDFLLLFSIIAMFFACSGEKKDIIPQRKMAAILVDIHLADEIAANRYSVAPETELDSASLYGWLFEKHAVTRAQFDSSVVYYASKSDALNKIYKNVSDRVSKMEAELARIAEEESKKSVIYEDTKMYRLPLDGKREKIPFEVPLSGEGDYTVNARIIMQKTDQSVNPRITAYFWYDDGTPEGSREYFRSIPIKKNDRPNMYSVSKMLDDPKYTHLKGFILDHDNTDTLFVKNAVVLKISVTK